MLANVAFGDGTQLPVSCVVTADLWARLLAPTGSEQRGAHLEGRHLEESGLEQPNYPNDFCRVPFRSYHQTA